MFYSPHSEQLGKVMDEEKKGAGSGIPYSADGVHCADQAITVCAVHIESQRPHKKKNRSPLSLRTSREQTFTDSLHFHQPSPWPAALNYKWKISLSTWGKESDLEGWWLSMVVAWRLSDLTGGQLQPEIFSWLWATHLATKSARMRKGQMKQYKNSLCMSLKDELGVRGWA